MVIREVVFCLLVRLRSMLYESEVGLSDLSFTSVFFPFSLSSFVPCLEPMQFSYSFSSPLVSSFC